MKKKLEAELISIAHRILKLKNKSDVVQLHQETQKLYEKLSVLRFVEENFSEVKPTIGQAEIEEKFETGFDYTSQDTNVPQPLIAAESSSSPDPDPAPAPEDDNDEQESEEREIKEPETPEEEKLASMLEVAGKAYDVTHEKEPEQLIAEAEESISAESLNEEGKSEVPNSEEKPATESPAEAESFKPSFEWAFEPKEEKKQEDKPQEVAKGQIAFEDLLGSGYVDPVFVKPEELEREKPVWQAEEKKPDAVPISLQNDRIPVFKINETTEKPVSLNDRLSKGITVGLNDRIAFVKNLFGNSNEDYNRVLSQLITFDTFSQAQDFIDNMVKPDYNNWEGKEEYAQRFMEVVEKKFT